uniref:hypothetical protein Ycf88 n=1 Tax=Nitzschia traheaformis TaxID=1881117 RepID=UPI001EF9EE48|nr:hypothetical protein Ycf88 [Nitzschia traheaformis]ULD15873.1 hypothetical protein Ycf88 [Nitzschia traheaformis]
MNPFLYEIHCKCKEEFSIIKKRKIGKKRPPKPFCPDSDSDKCKTFQIRYEQKLSSIAKLLLNSFQNKYLYHAIDDILYLLKSNPAEQKNLLEILYAPVLSLQNNFFINFFDIWINEIYLNDVSKINKFLTTSEPNVEPFSYITIKLLYRTKIPIKKEKLLW